MRGRPRDGRPYAARTPREFEIIPCSQCFFFGFYDIIVWPRDARGFWFIAKGETVRKRIVFIVSAVLLSALWTAGAASAFAGEQNVAARPEISVVNATQGDGDVDFVMILDNGSDRSFSGITAEIDRKSGFSAAGKPIGDSTIGAREKNEYVFSVDIDDGASYGNHTLSVTFYHDGASKTELAKGSVLINVSRKTVPSSMTNFDVPALDMAYEPEDGDSLKAGETNVLSVVITNRGNIMLQDVQVTLALPDIMSIENSVAVQYVGYMGVGESKTVRFPVHVDKKAEDKIYSISVKMNGLSRGAAAAFDRAIYIQVTGGEKKTENKDIEIGDISLPDAADAGAEFVMRFSVGNKGQSDAENVKIELVPDEGIVNKTKNVFVEPVLKPGESKNYEVTFFSDKEKATRKSYAIRISATAGTGDAAVTASQYAGIFLNKEQAAGEVKNPQIIVDNYSLGKEYAKAGERFNLSIDLYNTSSEDLLNIKVSLRAESGAFVPVGSSNSFFIEKMAAKERVSNRITMAVNPNAEQMTTALNVEMSYEDLDGAAFQGTDTISIPVMQDTSLTVDDIIAPPDLYAGVQTGLDVRFYNTGKTQLRNLRVAAEGNFDAVESTSYYAGNMASGANDRYSFGFTPREEGPLNGKIVFSYDDPSGERQTVEKEFSFTILPPPAEEDFAQELPTEEPKSKTPLYAGAAAALVLIVALPVLKGFLKRRKMRLETEIDDEQL
jgi:hypothetical protein